MTIYISIDDTDMPDSPGTGRLARQIIEQLGKKYNIHAITRHQLYVHPDIPYTSHNSAAAISIHDVPEDARENLFDEVTFIVKKDAAKGSDPGVCLAHVSQINPAVVLFGKDAKSMVLTQEQALSIAEYSNIRLVGLDGTKGGIIGALAAVGLAASGSDGRYIHVGTIRNLYGEAEISDIKAAGIPDIISVDGKPVQSGKILFRKFPQPVRIQGSPVLLVREDEGSWIVERRD
ncbi:MAG: ABC transporter substrate-binding protein [Methanomicrobiales archaeon]|nr:ABC transporter substrate-binding protein [Methanomicrobiales archaeon]